MHPSACQLEPLLALNHCTWPIAMSSLLEKPKTRSLRRARRVGKTVWIACFGISTYVPIGLIALPYQGMPIVDAEERVNLIADGRAAAAHVEQDDSRFGHCLLLETLKMQ